MVPHTRLYSRLRGEWGGWDFGWAVCSVSVCHRPAERLIAIGPNGEVQAIGGGQSMQEEPVGDGTRSPRTRGPLREVRGIAQGRAYAVGTTRQAYVREAPNVWRCIDETARRAGESLIAKSFESIDGFCEDEIYAVGWDGEIWHFDGSRWDEIASPTNLGLHRIRCAEDGTAYACGKVGTLLRGRGRTWTVVDHQATKEALWGLEWFAGHLYVSSTRFVYQLKGDELRRIDFDKNPPETCYHLSAADGVLWSIGARNVMEFDGGKWSEVLDISRTTESG
jgi:hypothetical protein